MEPWSFFRRKFSSRFYGGQAELSFDKLAQKVSPEVKVCSLRIRIYSETVIPKGTKKIFPQEKPQDIWNAVLINLPKTFTMKSGKLSRKVQKSHEWNNIFQRKIAFFDTKPWKHWASLWQPCWKRLAELLKKKLDQNLKNSWILYFFHRKNSSPKWSSRCERRSFDKKAEWVLPEPQKFLASDEKTKFYFFSNQKNLLLNTFLWDYKSQFLQPCTNFIPKRPKKLIQFQFGN